MYEFMIALLLFIALCLGSMFLTFFFTVLQSQSGRHVEPTLNNIIMVQFSLLVTTITDAVGDVVSQTAQTLFGFFADIFGQSRRVVQVFIVALILIEVSNNTDIVLKSGDTSWRCVIQPLFQNVILSIGQILRVIYDGFIPIYNYNYVVYSQAVQGSISIAVKCDLTSVVMSIKLLVESWIAVFQSLFMWSGIGQMSTENNIFVNEWNVTEVASKTQYLVAKQHDLVECVCEGLADVIDIAFVVVRQRELPIAINHAVNIPLSIIQTVFQLLPMFGPVFPTLNKPLYHLNGAIFNIMKYLDRVLEQSLKKSIQLFVDDFEFEGVPEEFVGATAARGIMAFTHASHTVYRTAAHIVLPIPIYITNVDYMMKAMRFDQAVRQLDLFMLNLSNNAYWLLEITDKFTKAIAKSVSTGGELRIVGIPKHVRLTCEPSEKWTVLVACTPYLGLTAYTNLWYIGANLVGELLWKSIFTQQQNVLRTLQRYDGPSYPRIESVSCEYRKSVKWDMTTDPNNCLCDTPVGYSKPEYTALHPFGVPTYDPFCNQPNLNANVFGNIERLVKLIDSAAKFTVGANRAVSTYVALYLEVIRIVLKTLLNLPDIFEDKFFHHKVNCGYGASEIALEKYWIEEGNKIEPCGTPRTGWMAHKGYCYPIHDTIRYAMCEVTSNKANKKALCVDENKEGCMCNIALPLDDTSLCSCVYTFPDTAQEIAQEAFANDVLSLTYDKSEHWCNTYHLEWLLFYVDNLALVVDSFFSSLHPAYDSQANAYCQQESYSMAQTSILHYSESQFNEQKALYDALSITYSTKSCKIYGSHDFICSTSMTVRSAVRFITDEVRELIMTLFEILGGSTDGITVNFGNRLCDLQRAAAGLSSTIASIFPKGLVSDGIRIGFAKIIFSYIDIPIEILNAVNHAVQFLLSILTNTAGFNLGSIQQPVFNFIIAEIDIFINWVRGFLNGFETLFESIVRGSGAIFRTFDEIIVIFRSLMTDAAIEMISLMFKVLGGVIEMFTGGGIYTDFFKDLWRLIGKLIEMIMKNAGKVLDAILNLLGPVGQFIRDLSGEICGSLQDVLCALSAGNFCDLGCPGIQPASFSAPPIIGEAAEAVGGFFDDIFGRRLHSSLHNLPKILHEELKWDGVSPCDMYVHAYKDYNFTDLRPLERVQLLQCVEQRALAVEMGRQIDLPIPHDIVYNWKRKYAMLYHLLQSGTIYSQYLMSELNSKDMIRKMKLAGVDTELYLPLWNKVRVTLKQFTLATHLDHFIHSLFHSFDKNIKTSDTAMGNIYRIYKHTSKAAKAVYNHTKDIDMNYDFKQAGKAIAVANITWPSIPSHITHPLKTFNRVTIKPTKTTNPYRLKSRRFILRAAGLNTDITPCEEQADSNVCVNCLVVDNLLNTILTEGDRMAKYYQYTYGPVILPSFIEYFNNEENEARSKAWREDMGGILDRAATKAGEAIEREAEKAIRGIERGAEETQKQMEADAANQQRKWEEDVKANERGYRLQGRQKLHANYTTSMIDNFQRARKDWEALFNFTYRPDIPFAEVLEQFISVSDDSYVPFFAHSASWYVTYPFAGECPMSIIYGTEPGYDTTNKRLDKIEESLYYMLYTFIGIYLFEFFTGFPIISLATPFFPLIIVGIYMLTVYGYTYPCIPNVPNMLLDDLFAFANDRVFPNCWCQYWPGLAESCNLDNCFLCSIQTDYRSCTENIPDLVTLGIFWAPLTFLRVNFPEFLVYLYDNPPFLWVFRRIENLDTMFQSAIYKVPLTDIENDCFRLHIGDIVMFLVILFVGSKLLQFGVPVVFRTLQHGLKIFMMLLGIFYSMAVSIELSTVTGVGRNTYQRDGL